MFYIRNMDKDLIKEHFDVERNFSGVPRTEGSVTVERNWPKEVKFKGSKANVESIIEEFECSVR